MQHLSNVGNELARRVARRLSQGHSLAYYHPYYCGTGLFFIEGAYLHCETGDWALPTKAQALGLESKGKDSCRVFQTEISFVAWLERQTNESLMGYNGDDNQRITLKRLSDFVGVKSQAQELELRAESLGKRSDA